MLIISSLRFTADGAPPARPASPAHPPRELTPLRPSLPGEKEHSLIAPIRNKSSMKRCNSASMRTEPLWESNIRGSKNPHMKCKKLMHLRNEGISKNTHLGLVAKPVGRSFVTPSELNMLKEKKNRHYCDLSVTSPSRLNESLIGLSSYSIASPSTSLSGATRMEVHQPLTTANYEAKQGPAHLKTAEVLVGVTDVSIFSDDILDEDL
jgi:hypothetical protein